MRVPIVRHGDETTTRGKVIALTATIHDDGRKIALHGDQATCGNCKGLWNIISTGEGAGENGRAAVVNGDHVLCPCGKNRVFAGVDAGMFIHTDAGARSANAPGTAQPAPRKRYDEQFVLTNHAGKPLAGVRYRVRVGPNVIVTGTTDSGGRTQRIVTDDAKRICLDVAA